MGKKSRKSTADVIAKRKARAASAAFVARPFEGIPFEADLVCFKELVPAATATAKLNEEHGGTEITFASLLPGGAQAMHRQDGVVFAGMQTPFSSSDPSRDVAAAILQAQDAEPAAIVNATTNPGEGPRLQDILDLEAPFSVTVREGFDYWIAPGQAEGEEAEQLAEALEQANARVNPTEKLVSASGAYWTRMGEKVFVRWARTEDEEAVVDALARLHAAGENTFGGAGRFLGTFRAHGITVPVWELDADSQPDDAEERLAAFAKDFDAALAKTTPLSAQERSARAGVASRQLTIR
ncbi:DUF5926 family protein [Sediminivirga luteola]|uniref:DUF5926 family protein n=1 Tax=Sediminivirga luteola TaxID=1774748 RepID=UPI001F598F89|nr:DUF5926 family protein [Sediminivirga luteola]MCI2264374.1 DUF5926 family protein [Sediminivirga luteola]